MTQTFVSEAGALGAILADCAGWLVWAEFVEAEGSAAAGDAGVANRAASSQQADATRKYSAAQLNVI
jgi:hypothetical protein